MEDKKLMTIQKSDGTIEKVEVILTFEFKDTQKEYVIYTKNETDEQGNVTIYVSTIKEENGAPVLYAIDTDEEWARIKDVLRELSKED